MTVDISRKTFDPRRHTAWTTTMQGRVATDAPINENQAQRDRRVRALLTDLAGRCGYPAILPDSFKIGISGGQLTIAPGRYYVDGHLADNFGTGTPLFDPVLSEQRGSDPLLFEDQPYGTSGAVDPVDGTHIVYLDVWQRDVTFLEDQTILDPGIATDSFARRQTVWQIRTFGPVGSGTVCSTDPATIPGWPTAISPSRARLTTRANPANAVSDPCLLPPGALYRGIDNRTYLVAIHGFDAAGAPLVKFSRTNGTVATAILALPQADVLEVAQVAKDDFLRFNPGDWVEVTDEARLLAGQSGTMARVLTVDDPSNTITLEDPLPAGALQLVSAGPAADQDVRPVLRRWDQAGEIRDENGAVLVDLDAAGAIGLIPLPTDGTFVSLEDGVEAAFTLAAGIGAAHINDNWSFVARYADSTVEELQAAPPQDYHHHYCRLAMVSAAGGEFIALIEDCRTPLGEDCDCCCTVTVEVGDSIQAAIDSLPIETGGCVCLVAGRHFIDQTLNLATSNVHIVGESRGAIIEHRGDGAVLQLDGVSNVDIDMVGFCHRDGGDAEAMLEVFECNSVNIWRCGFAAKVGSTSVGIGIKGSHDVAVRDCDFGALAFGVITVGEGGLLTVADNVFALGGDEFIGHTAVAAIEATGPLCVTGNTISGVLNGIVINDDVTSDTRISLAAGSLIADNQIGLEFEKKLDPDEAQRGIDSAADGCTIRGNRIVLEGRVAIGIFASGVDLELVENQIEVEGEDQGGFQVGIIIGATDEKAAQLTSGVSVAQNSVRGTGVAIIASHASDLTIADNRLQHGVKPQMMALLLIQTGKATVRGNTVGRSVLSLFSIGGTHLRAIGNHFADCWVGVAALMEMASTIEGNSIDRASSFGIVLGLTGGRAMITGNRLRNCGFDGQFACGIGALMVIGEFAVCGNEIVDTGIGPDGAFNAEPVYGILGLFVLEGLISENLVTLTQLEARPEGLEDRALMLLGMWELSQGENEPVSGWPCTVTGNKFNGKGLSALVQLLGFKFADNLALRFERVFFTNNYCLHLGTRDKDKASVILNASAGVVIGNQIKGLRDAPSIDMSDMKGTEVGNITSGAIINDPNFPTPQTDFNLLF